MRKKVEGSLLDFGIIQWQFIYNNNCILKKSPFFESVNYVQYVYFPIYLKNTQKSSYYSQSNFKKLALNIKITISLFYLQYFNYCYWLLSSAIGCALLIPFQSSSCSITLRFKLQIYFESSVSFSYTPPLEDVIWLAYLNLNWVEYKLM